MREAAAALEPAREELADLVAGSSSPEALDKKLAKWRPSDESWEALGDAIFVPAVLSDLAGQLMVRGGGKNLIQMDAADKPAFLDQPWEEAIAEWKRRGIMKPTELQTLLTNYAQRADKARQLMLEQVQSFVRQELERSLRDGGTMKEFANAIRSGDASLGITADDPAYLNMVFRTNVQSAYGAGRYRAITDPDVVQDRPFVEYRTVGDARVRPEHAVLDGNVYAVDSAAWQAIAPPNGYNCRCSLVNLTREEAAGKKILSEVPAAYEPTPGFEGPPVAQVDAPTPSLAPVLRQAVPEVAPAQSTPQPEPTPSPQLGKVGERVFGRSLSDPEIGELIGAKAALPSGYALDVNYVQAEPSHGLDRPDVGTGYIRVIGAVKNAKGQTVGNISRAYARDTEGRAIVEHSSFYLDEDQQGKGIGGAVFNAQLDAYATQGVERVVLDADAVGRYVWTRAGFDWTDEDQARRVRDQLSAYVAKFYGGNDAAARIMASIKTPQDIARLVINGKPVGKTFLIDQLNELIPMAQAVSKIKRL